jgi:hypothetical protein
MIPIKKEQVYWSVNDKLKIYNDKDSYRISYLRKPLRKGKSEDIWVNSNFFPTFEKMNSFIEKERIETSDEYNNILRAYLDTRNYFKNKPIFNIKSYCDKYGDLDRRTIDLNPRFSIETIKMNWKLVRKVNPRLIDKFFTRFDLLFNYIVDEYIVDVMFGEISLNNFNEIMENTYIILAKEAGYVK